MAFNNKVQYDIIGWAEVDLDAAVADKFTWTVNHPILIHQVGFIYTEATDAAIVTKGVVSLDVTPSGGSRTEKATYTAEVSKSIGYEGKLTDSNGSANLGILVDAGDTVIFEHKIQQTSLEAGKGVFVVYYELVPDGSV